MKFQDLLSEGNASLGRGRFKNAAASFEAAVDVSSSDEERAQAHQLRGIALRLDRQFVESETELRVALDIVGETSATGGRILRDLGMCFLDKAVLDDDTPSFDKAAFYFGESIGVLGRYNEKVEVAVSMGFVGRFYLLTGKPQAAASMLRSAQQMLNGRHPTYELNNLVWLARASVKDRWRYTLKAAKLVIKTGDVRRAIEYLIILVGGNALYTKIRESR